MPKIHHAKEEDILFVEMDKADIHCNPSKQMLYEHDIGRGFVKGMDKGISDNDVEKIIENAMGYCTLLDEHIFKEKEILYPMTEDAFDEKTKRMILKKFKKADSKKKNEISKYEKFADE